MLGIDRVGGGRCLPSCGKSPYADHLRVPIAPAYDQNTDRLWHVTIRDPAHLGELLLGDVVALGTIQACPEERCTGPVGPPCGRKSLHRPAERTDLGTQLRKGCVEPVCARAQVLGDIRSGCTSGFPSVADTLSAAQHLLLAIVQDHVIRIEGGPEAGERRAHELGAHPRLLCIDLQGDIAHIVSRLPQRALLEWLG